MLQLTKQDGPAGTSKDVELMAQFQHQKRLEIEMVVTYFSMRQAQNKQALTLLFIARSRERCGFATKGLVSTCIVQHHVQASDRRLEYPTHKLTNK